MSRQRYLALVWGLIAILSVLYAISMFMAFQMGARTVEAQAVLAGVDSLLTRTAKLKMLADSLTLQLDTLQLLMCKP